MIDYSVFGDFFAYASLVEGIGINILALSLIVICISLIPNSSTTLSKDRAETAVAFSSILAITGVLTGIVGLLMLLGATLWALLENYN